MRTMKILLAMVLIATQVQAAVVSNFIGREIPQRVDASATAASTTIGSVSFTDAGDLVTFNNHGLTAGTAVSFSSITSTTGISINTTYYVISPTTNTFQLSATVGGAALALTTNGSGIFNGTYYAVVHATVRNGGTFSVNGVVFLTSMTWNVINNLNGLQRVPGSLSGNANGVAGPALGVLPALGKADLPATGGATITQMGATYSWSGVDIFANSTAMTSIDHTFKVPAGTVLVGSGSASYVIEIIKI